MIISIGVDHGGIALREALIAHLEKSGHQVIDHGTYTTESVDYPDFAQKVGADIVSKKAEIGILICKTGVGISIAANKISGVRAALIHNEIDAEFSRLHNNANIICMGSAHEDEAAAIRYTEIFMSTQFEGGRHARRVDKMENPTSYC